MIDITIPSDVDDILGSMRLPIEGVPFSVFPVVVERKAEAKTSVVVTAIPTTTAATVDEDTATDGKKRIYTIRCREGKYYVGSTTKAVRVRYMEHVEGNDAAAAWTRKYAPVELLKCTFVETKPLDEDTKTLELISAHGMDNVRGGTYIEVELPEHKRKTIEDMMKSRDSLCFRCGNAGHFASSCHSTRAPQPLLSTSARHAVALPSAPHALRYVPRVPVTYKRGSPYVKPARPAGQMFFLATHFQYHQFVFGLCP